MDVTAEQTAAFMDAVTNFVRYLPLVLIVFAIAHGTRGGK